MDKCMNCGSTKLKTGFLTDERGLLYVKMGQPSFKNQLLGKGKKISVRVCSICGHCSIFTK